MANPKKTDKKAGMTERRRSKRLPVLGTFSLFAVVPKKGGHRLIVHDVSDLGIGFDIDTEGEEATDFPVKVGETLDLHFYLNQSLYIPLSTRIARIETHGQVRRVGAEFNSTPQAADALRSFVQMLDKIIDIAQISKG